jgi:hypothetical protein
MEFQTATGPYIMTTPVTPACTLLTNIGMVPKVWGNNNYIDFETWDSYRVSHGKEIVYQPWSQGFMNLRSNDNGLQIKIDSSNATASYFTFDPDIYVTDSKPAAHKTRRFQLLPNPAHGTVEILTNSDLDSLVEIFDLQGKKVKFEIVSKTRSRIKLNIDLLKSGLYQVKLRTNAGIQTQRMLVN